MTLAELRLRYRDQILAIAARHGVTNVRVFGSFARGEAGEKSDLDLLIVRGPQRTPFFPGGLLADLQDAVGRPVDLATEAGLPPVVRERVLKEAVLL